jgi:hypothetical protein
VRKGPASARILYYFRFMSQACTHLTEFLCLHMRCSVMMKHVHNRMSMCTVSGCTRLTVVLDVLMYRFIP